MSVLENLRKGTDSTSTRLIIGVVVALFIFWGPVNRNKGTKGQTAIVNGVPITEAQFRFVYNRVADNNGRMSDEEKAQLSENVRQNLIQEEVMVQEAERLGIVVSEAEWARDVVDDPSFHDENGKFSEKLYQKILNRMGTSREQYEQNLMRRRLVAKLGALVTQSVTVNEAEVKAAWQRDATRLDLAFVRLPVEAFLDDVVVADADRDAYVTANADKIKARYDEGYDRFYNLPKRYQLRTILLKTGVAGMDDATVQARAEAIRAEAAAGADFESLARRWSEDLSASNGGQLGVMAKDQIDPALVTAADAAGAGNVSAVTKTDRGFQILLVEKIDEAKVISLDEAKPEIAVAMIKEEKAPALVEAHAAKIIEAWKAAGAAPTELLEPKHLAVDTTGEFSLGDPEVPRLGESPELRAQLSAATTGYVVPTSLVIKGARFVVAVQSRTEPSDADYQNEKVMVKQGLLMQRQQQFAKDWQAELVSKAQIVLH